MFEVRNAIVRRVSVVVIDIARRVLARTNVEPMGPKSSQGGPHGPVGLGADHYFETCCWPGLDPGPAPLSGSQRFKIDSIAKMFETFNQALGVCGLGPADEVVGTEVLVESSSFASRAAPPARSIV
jgi:hypothetical protein